LAKIGLHSQQSSEGRALQATVRLQILQCEVLREKRKRLGIFDPPRWMRAACLLVEPSLVLARNTNKGELTAHDEKKWGLRLERGLDYIVKVKVNGKVLATTKCSLSSYSLVHITIIEADSISVVTNCKTYQNLWDFGFIVGAE